MSLKNIISRLLIFLFINYYNRYRYYFNYFWILNFLKIHKSFNDSSLYNFPKFWIININPYIEIRIFKLFFNSIESIKKKNFNYNEAKLRSQVLKSPFLSSLENIIFLCSNLRFYNVIEFFDVACGFDEVRWIRNFQYSDSSFDQDKWNHFERSNSNVDRAC